MKTCRRREKETRYSSNKLCDVPIAAVCFVAIMFCGVSDAVALLRAERKTSSATLTVPSNGHSPKTKRPSYLQSMVGMDFEPYHIIHHLKKSPENAPQTLFDTSNFVRYSCGNEGPCAGMTIGDVCPSGEDDGFCLVKQGTFEDDEVPCVGKIDEGDAGLVSRPGKCKGGDSCSSDLLVSHHTSPDVFHVCGLDNENANCCTDDPATSKICCKNPEAEGEYVCAAGCNDVNTFFGNDVPASCSECQENPLKPKPVTCECRSFGKCKSTDAKAAWFIRACSEKQIGSPCSQNPLSPSETTGVCGVVPSYVAKFPPDNTENGGYYTSSKTDVACQCMLVGNVAMSDQIPSLVPRTGAVSRAARNVAHSRKRIMTGKIMRRLTRNHHPVTQTQGCTQIDATVSPGLMLSIGLDFINSVGHSCDVVDESNACIAANSLEFLGAKAACEALTYEIITSCRPKLVEDLPVCAGFDEKDPESCDATKCDKTLSTRKQCAFIEKNNDEGYCVQRCFMGVEATITVGFSPLAVGPFSAGTFYGSGKIAVTATDAIPCSNGHASQSLDQDGYHGVFEKDGKKFYSFFGSNPWGAIKAQCGPFRLLKGFFHNWIASLLKRPNFQHSMFNSLVTEGNDLTVESGHIQDLQTTMAAISADKVNAVDENSDSSLRYIRYRPSSSPVYDIGKVWNFKFYDPEWGLLARWNKAETESIEMVRRDPLPAVFPNFPHPSSESCVAKAVEDETKCAAFDMKTELCPDDKCEMKRVCNIPKPKCWNPSNYEGSDLDYDPLDATQSPPPCNSKSRIKILDNSESSIKILDEVAKCMTMTAPCDTPEKAVYLFHWFARWIFETAPIRALFLKDAIPGTRGRRKISRGNERGREYTLHDCRSFPVKEDDTIDSEYGRETWKLSSASSKATGPASDTVTEYNQPYSYFTNPRLLCSLGENIIPDVPSGKPQTNYRKKPAVICGESAESPTTHLSAKSKWRTIRNLRGISGAAGDPGLCPDPAYYFERAPCQRTLFSSKAGYESWCGTFVPPPGRAPTRTDAEERTSAINRKAKGKACFQEEFPKSYHIPMFAARVFPGLVAAVRLASREILAKLDGSEDGGDVEAQNRVKMQFISAQITKIVDILAGKDIQFKLVPQSTSVTQEDPRTAPAREFPFPDEVSSNDESSVTSSWAKRFKVMTREEVNQLDLDCTRDSGCSATKVLTSTPGEAFNGVTRYSKEIQRWSKEQEAQLAQARSAIDFDERLLYEVEFAFSATLGSSTVGACTPDTNALQVSISKRHGGIYDPLESGHGKVTASNRATQIAVTGHPFPMFPVLQVSGSVSRDHVLHRTDFEGEFKFFIISVKDEVSADSSGANGAHSETNGGKGNTGLLGEKVTGLLNDMGLNVAHAVPLIAYGVIPLVETLGAKLRDFVQRLRLSKSAASMKSSAKNAVPNFDPKKCLKANNCDAELLGIGNVDSFAENTGKFIVASTRFALAQAVTSLVASLAKPVNIQNYFTVTLTFESDTFEWKPNFQVFLNYLSLAELVVGPPGFQVKPMISWGKEWDITEVVTEAMKGTARSIAEGNEGVLRRKSTIESLQGDNVDNYAESETHSYCGMPLSSDRAVASDRCNMCVALTSVLLRETAPSIKTLTKLCNSQCHDSKLGVLCKDVAKRIEIITRSNRDKKNALGFTLKNDLMTYNQFRDLGLKGHFLGVNRCKDIAEPTKKVECAAEEFCYDLYIGCRLIQGGTAEDPAFYFV